MIDVINEYNELLEENKLLKEEDVDFVCKHIEGIVSNINSISSTYNKIEDRLVKRFIDDVKKVLSTIPTNSLNYMYFYFAITILFTRIYASSEFEKCFDGNNAGRYENPILKYQSDTKTYGNYSYYLRDGSHSFSLHTNSKANEYNYLFNKCLFRNTERDAEVDKFFNTTLSIQPKWEWDIVKNLLQEINNYSLGN